MLVLGREKPYEYFLKQKAQHHWACSKCTDPLSHLSIHHFTSLHVQRTCNRCGAKVGCTLKRSFLSTCHCCQCILLSPSSLSSSPALTQLTPSFTPLINLLSGSPRGLPPANSNLGIRPLTKSLCTCPNHLSLASLASTIKHLTFADPLMFSFLILSILVTAWKKFLIWSISASWLPFSACALKDKMQTS